MAIGGTVDGGCVPEATVDVPGVGERRGEVGAGSSSRDGSVGAVTFTGGGGANQTGGVGPAGRKGWERRE